MKNAMKTISRLNKNVYRKVENEMLDIINETIVSLE